MTQISDIRVPHIGDFKDVAVIEVLIKQGQIVAQDEALLTVESEKATMEIPSPSAGRIESVAVKVGDKVSQGTVIAEIAGLQATPATDRVAVPLKSHDTPVAPEFDLVVIGAGPGGYSAAFRAADLGMKVALIERYDVLGGVCLNVGCIPSKALLHVAGVKEEAERIASNGVRFDPPVIDLEALRSFKSATVKRLTDGLSQMAKARKVEIVCGSARFESPNQLAVTSDGGGTQTIGFKTCVIAAGSSPVRLPMLPSDRRIVDSTGALQLREIPRRMLVIGGGIIGLEMATVYSALGARVDIVERLPELLPGVDPDAVAIWRKRNAHRFDGIWLRASVESAEIVNDEVVVTIMAEDLEKRSYDLVLQSAGRTPNSDALGLSSTGLKPDQRGFLAIDKQMRTSVSNIFAIGDIVGGPMLAHKAVHEGHVAAEAAAGQKSYFDAKVIPSVAYTDPEIAWVGLSEKEAIAAQRSVKSVKFPWAASGRAIASGARYGMTKLVFDTDTHRVVGGVIVGPHAGDMIGEICLAIEMGADAIDIGKTIHPHPTLGETIGMAAELFEGVCTDLLPVASGRRTI
ncbi:dihydrolipoyl dehydrogenase [Bradyrhizobium sp. CCBAU 53421]|uniref:dihydrolipoyl dehydrogenase n=1 Tax=Bradyrhizobium sp. CCBAU 53421 TaxID=1325120 RepID=UPI001889E6DD|nr:dihydrolipoyl dehydrogenase [Bradyrhizobium sp. CCBAU 53421]QOZ36514.1 dihydrolipoyl dehydrogenase [Bradyrhizobium sp. CCBAU 53421]